MVKEAKAAACVMEDVCREPAYFNEHLRRIYTACLLEPDGVSGTPRVQNASSISMQGTSSASRFLPVISWMDPGAAMDVVR
jgi:hypothetical protein